MKPQSDVHDKQQGTQPEGVAWQFYVVVAVIGLGVLGLVAKAVGLF
jgi:hypothetical protein